ncbi:unnamed protein product, partial [marine sediment metagenome]
LSIWHDPCNSFGCAGPSGPAIQVKQKDLWARETDG